MVDYIIVVITYYCSVFVLHKGTINYYYYYYYYALKSVHVALQYDDVIIIILFEMIH